MLPVAHVNRHQLAFLNFGYVVIVDVSGEQRVVDGSTVPRGDRARLAGGEAIVADGVLLRLRPHRHGAATTSGEQHQHHHSDLRRATC